MATGIKPSAAKIIAEFCGPLVREKENEPDTDTMVRQIITSLGIKIRHNPERLEKIWTNTQERSTWSNRMCVVMADQRYLSLNRDYETSMGRLTFRPATKVDMAILTPNELNGLFTHLPIAY